MIEIKEKSRDFTKVQVYNMTASPEIMSLKDIDRDTIFTVDGYLIFDDTRDGETAEILSLKTKESGVISMQSKTAIASFKDMVDVMDSDTFKVKKIDGTTKSGREYINLVLAEED